MENLCDESNGLVRFFCAMCEDERARFAEERLHFFRKNGSSFETLSIIFKYLSESQREQVLTAVLNRELQDGTEILSFFHFFRFSIRALDEKNQKRLLQKLESITDERYRATVCYLVGLSEAMPILRDNSKVLLLIPEFLSSISFLQPPIDFMITASILEKNGISCDILDNRVFHYPLKTLLQMVSHYDDIVVTSTPIDMAQKYYIDYRYAIFCMIFSKIRETYPQKNIYIVGPHGTIAKEILLSDIHAEPETVIAGEFEFTIAERISSRFGKKIAETNPLSVIPDYSKIRTSWYFERVYDHGLCLFRPNTAIMQLSRGCPYHCSFCYDFYGHDFRSKEYDVVVRELNYLKHLKVSNIFFIDQTFTLNRELVMRVCHFLLANDFGIPWQCETRADLLDPELVTNMKKAGCAAIWLGIESFSQEILDKSKKGITVNEIYRALDICRSCGMNLCGFIMLGMPGETKETLECTVRAIERTGLHISPSINRLALRMGSPLFEQMASRGVKITSFLELNNFSGNIENYVYETDLESAEAYLKEIWRRLNESTE